MRIRIRFSWSGGVMRAKEYNRSPLLHRSPGKCLAAVAMKSEAVTRKGVSALHKRADPSLRSG